MTVFDTCICYPTCSTPTAEVEEALCRFANGSLIVKSTFDGCDDVRYVDIDWNFATAYALKNSLMTGCITTAMGGSEASGDPVLSDSCSSQPAMQCTPCPERTDPDLLMIYRPPTCD